MHTTAVPTRPPVPWRSPLTAAVVGLAAVALVEIVGNVAARSLLSLPLLVAQGVCVVTAILGLTALTLDAVLFWALAVVGGLTLLVGEALLVAAVGARADLRTYGAAAAVLLLVLAAIGAVRVGGSTATGGRVPVPFVATLAAAVAVGLVATFVAGRVIPGPVAPGYVRFGLAGTWASGLGADQVVPNALLRIPVEVHPAQRAAGDTYRIAARLDGRPVGTVLTRTLHSGETYRATVTVPSPSDGCRHRLTLDGRADGGWRGQVVTYLRGPASLGCAHH